MIEANTTFTLIRVRTTLPVCIYWFLFANLFPLHSFEWNNLVPLAFLIAVCQLFRSYESKSATITIYNTFLAIGLGSLLLPQIVWFTPIFLFSMIPFQALSLKSFFASILGLATPYWFLFGYAFLSDQISSLYSPIAEMTQFYPISFDNLPKNMLVSWAFITFLQFIFGFHYLQTCYIDRTRTRIYHSFLVYIGWFTAIFSILQPVHLSVLLHIQVICTAFIGGHLFTLTRNRFSGILFMVTIVLFILLTLSNLWMQFFSF